MKNSNYRLIIKQVDANIYFFIEEKTKYFYGLFSKWNLIEGLSFKSIIEAKKYIKQLEVNRAKLEDTSIPRSEIYYDTNTDTYIEM